MSRQEDSNVEVPENFRELIIEKNEEPLTEDEIRERYIQQMRKFTWEDGDVTITPGPGPVKQPEEVKN